MRFCLGVVSYGGIEMSVGETVRDALRATEGRRARGKGGGSSRSGRAAVPTPSLPNDIGFLWKALVVGLLIITCHRPWRSHLYCGRCK
jgi:hypothetical protein